MLFKKTIAVYCKKYRNMHCRYKEEILNLKLVDNISYHQGLRELSTFVLYVTKVSI